jgi:hypothetical protein
MKNHLKDSGSVQVEDSVFSALMVDVLLMEAYVSEKMPVAGQDTLSLVKKQLYDSIFAKYKTDSASFFTTLYYYQAHPKEFSVHLKVIDSVMNKIIPGDTSTVNPQIPVPDHIQDLPSFSEQEELMRNELLKTRFNSRKDKQGKQP